MDEPRYRIAPEHHEAAAKAALKLILESVSKLELEPRVRIQSVPDIRASNLRQRADEEHTIFRYPLVYLDSRVRLMVFRKEGTEYGSPSYGLIDDIAGFYQPISIDDLVTTIKPNFVEFLTNIDTVLSTMRLTRSREQH